MIIVFKSRKSAINIMTDKSNVINDVIGYLLIIPDVLNDVLKR